jgi:hypothetical protein
VQPVLPRKPKLECFEEEAGHARLYHQGYLILQVRGDVPHTGSSLLLHPAYIHLSTVNCVYPSTINNTVAGNRV